MDDQLAIIAHLDADASSGHRFLAPELMVPGTVLMQGGNLPVSAYYRPHRGHVLGLPMVRTDRWDMDHLTVLDTDQTWRTRLPQVLDQITRAHTPVTQPGTPAGLDALPPPRAASRTTLRPGVEADRSPQATDSVPHL